MSTGHLNLMGRSWRRVVGALALGFGYSALTKAGLSAYGAITAFGLFVAGVMFLIGRWHRRNLVVHRDEVTRLMHIARTDCHHH